MNVLLNKLHCGSRGTLTFSVVCVVLLSEALSDSGNKIKYRIKISKVNTEEITNGAENLSRMSSPKKRLNFKLIFEKRLPNRGPATPPNPATPLSNAKFFPLFLIGVLSAMHAPDAVTNAAANIPAIKREMYSNTILPPKEKIKVETEKPAIPIKMSGLLPTLSDNEPRYDEKKNCVSGKAAVINPT